MDPFECLFQSFEGAGSIFITTAQTLTSEQLKKYFIKAIIHINPRKQSQNEDLDQSSLSQLTINVQNIKANLTPHFYNTSYFISQARRSTNILVSCHQNRQMAAIFVFAHLILRYGYSIDYIWRLYDQRITNMSLSEPYIQKLRNLTKQSNPEDEAVKKFNETRIGQRMLRISKKYEQMGKNGSREYVSLKKSRRRHPQELNAELGMISAKKGGSETDFNDCGSSELSTRYRERSSTGSELKTYRSTFKSFGDE